MQPTPRDQSRMRCSHALHPTFTHAATAQQVRHVHLPKWWHLQQPRRPAAGEPPPDVPAKLHNAGGSSPTAPQQITTSSCHVVGCGTRGIPSSADGKGPHCTRGWCAGTHVSHFHLSAVATVWNTKASLAWLLSSISTALFRVAVQSTALLAVLTPNTRYIICWPQLSGMWELPECHLKVILTISPAWRSAIHPKTSWFSVIRRAKPAVVLPNTSSTRWPKQARHCMSVMT
jgi:hypothetical protein